MDGINQFRMAEMVAIVNRKKLMDKHTSSGEINEITTVKMISDTNV